MLLFAQVNAGKSLPAPGGRGLCPTCGGNVLARCGTIRVHHWAHVSGVECDPWAEGIGPWHLSWQKLARPEFVEVPRAGHRADILGNDDVVIELQRSPLSPQAIRERERHYGDMVWLLDATDRFGGMPSGERFFFSFGRTRHLDGCQKPVVLDFQSFLVEVEALTDALNGFSGFGRIRDRAWFVERYLSQRRSRAPLARARRRERRLDCWTGKPPWRLTQAAATFIDPRHRVKTQFPARSPYIPLERSRANVRNARHWPIWWDIIAQHPGLANGWTQSDFEEMRSLLQATPMILGGYVRLLPATVEQLGSLQLPANLDEMLACVDAHVKSGRIAELSPKVRAKLMEVARAQGVSVQERFLSRLGRKSSPCAAGPRQARLHPATLLARPE